MLYGMIWFDHFFVAVLDAWAKPESGIMDGNEAWLGRYHECVNIKQNSFTGQYCALNIGIVDPKTVSFYKFTY